MGRFPNELDDECPWKDFLERSMTSDATDDYPPVFGPIEIDGSMCNNINTSSAERSTLSSVASSPSPCTPSISVSEALRGVGGPQGGVEPGHRYPRAKAAPDLIEQGPFASCALLQHHVAILAFHTGRNTASGDDSAFHDL
jgi:hypothetical protein